MKSTGNIFLITVCYLMFSCRREEKKPTEKIFSLYPAKTKAQQGDWLNEHKETYYDFAAYLQSSPVRPDSIRKFIYIYKLGENTQAEDSLLNITRNYLECFFHLPTKIAGTFPLSCVPDTMKRITTDNEFQICTHFILDTLHHLPIPSDAAVAICFTKYDLYPSPSWNYVFGQADLNKRIGVWSFSRYGNVNNPKEFKQVLTRTLKVASHETGHMFSITHCVRYECVMNGSNSLNEMDASTLHLCPECMEKLSWNIGFDLKQHFAGLRAFYSKHGYTAESDFASKNIVRLEE